MRIKKAVIPIAGKGTRFLPATKQTPKEIIPILTKPMIHYIVEEAVNSGIEQVIFVTSSGKQSIEDYFDRNLELETFLQHKGKTKELEDVKKIGTMAEVISVRQKEQLGLGHAILCAKDIVGDEPFAVLLGDDLILNDYPVTKQLIDIYNEKEKSVIGVMDVAREDTSKYGIVDGTPLADNKNVWEMKTMVEKPNPADAPSTLATPGRYILTPEIFTMLQEIPRGAQNEYQLTDAINMLCKKDKVYSCIFKGNRFDTGNVRGYLEATIDFALRDPDLKDYAKAIMQKKLTEY